MVDMGVAAPLLLQLLFSKVHLLGNLGQPLGRRRSPQQALEGEGFRSLVVGSGASRPHGPIQGGFVLGLGETRSKTTGIIVWLGCGGRCSVPTRRATRLKQLLERSGKVAVLWRRKNVSFRCRFLLFH